MSMIEHLVILLEAYLLPLGWLGVFLASFIEEIIAPIPSAAVLLVAGVTFLSEGKSLFEPLFFTIALPAAFGITAGSGVIYSLSRFLGEVSIERFGKPFGFSRESVERTKEKLTRGSRDEISLFILRAIPVVPSVAISVSAGLLRMPWKTFLSMTFLGSLPRAMVLAFIGGKVGGAYRAYAETISRLENSILLGALILFIFWIAYLYWSRRSESVIS